KAFAVPVDFNSETQFIKVVPGSKNAVWLLLAFKGVIKLFNVQWHLEFMAQVEKGVDPATLFKWDEIASDVLDIEMSADKRHLWILGKDKVEKLDIASGEKESVALSPE